MKTQKLNKIRFLGALCPHAHRYVYEDGKTTRKSVRYKLRGDCCTCAAISVRNRKNYMKKYRDEHKEKMAAYQKKYRLKTAKKMKKYQKKYYKNGLKKKKNT